MLYSPSIQITVFQYLIDAEQSLRSGTRVEDIPENDWNDTCFYSFQCNLSAVLDFLTLQDKHNIHPLSIKKIKFICISCETVQKRLPKTGFSSCFKLIQIILIFSENILRAFNIFQVYQYFTIYRWCFFLKFEHFSWISNAQQFLKIGSSSYHFKLVKVPGTFPYWKAYINILFI